MRRFLLIAISLALGWVPVGTARAEEPDDPTERVTVWSGVSYQDLKVGTGATIRPGQILTLHSTGWLASGPKFWSSRDDDGPPLDFTLRGGNGGVIDGWVDGIPGMKVGGLRKLWVPAELAYGEKGWGTSIPPGSDLVFEVEVFAIVKKKKVD